MLAETETLTKSSEIHLHAKLHHAWRQDARHVLPRRPVPRGLRDDVVGVGQVKDVELWFHAHSVQLESAADAKIDLVAAAFGVERTGPDQVDRARGIATPRQGGAECCQDLRIADYVPRRRRNSCNVLIGAADSNVAGQREESRQS